MELFWIIKEFFVGKLISLDCSLILIVDLNFLIFSYSFSLESFKFLSWTLLKLETGSLVLIFFK